MAFIVMRTKKLEEIYFKREVARAMVYLFVDSTCSRLLVCGSVLYLSNYMHDIYESLSVFNPLRQNIRFFLINPSGTTCLGLFSC